MKFKVGDKVRILSDAMSGGEPVTQYTFYRVQSAIGEIGIINKIHEVTGWYEVINLSTKCARRWFYTPDQIELVEDQDQIADSPKMGKEKYKFGTWQDLIEDNSKLFDQLADARKIVNKCEKENLELKENIKCYEQILEFRRSDHKHTCDLNNDLIKQFTKDSKIIDELMEKDTKIRQENETLKNNNKELVKNLNDLKNYHVMLIKEMSNYHLSKN